MVKYAHYFNGKRTNNDNHRQNNHRNGNNKNGSKQYNKLYSMGKISTTIINKLYTPLDATNRFINLALQSVDEDSQSRQFLLESKEGIRKMSSLIKKLNGYAKKIETEMRKILE